MKKPAGLIFDIVLVFLAFLLGYLSLKNSQILPKCHISRLIYYNNEQLYIVKGFIESGPAAKDKKIVFIFKAESIQSGNSNYACCGNILVNLKSENQLSYGDELILRGNLYRPYKGNSLGRSYRDYLYNQGIRFIMNVKTDADIVCLNINKGFILKRLALRFKQKAESIIYRNTSFLTAAVLDAMILGEKKNIPWFVSDAMMKSGTLHILPRLYTKMPSIAL